MGGVRESTIGDLAGLWGEGVFGSPPRPQWAKARRSYLKHLVAAIGDVDVGDLAPRHVWDVQRYCSARGLKNTTANKVTHNVLRKLLSDAERAGMAPVGIWERIKGDRLPDDDESAGMALSLEERDAVIHAFAGHWAQPLVMFLFYTGVRIGEAAGLRQGDIDWHRGVFTIRRSRHRSEVTACKTRRSRATLKLPRAALAAITPLRRDRSPDEYLFRNKGGGPLTQDAFRCRVWRRVLSEHGLGAVRIHDARHTFATCCLEAGMPVAKVAAYLRDRIETVTNRYSHVLPIDDIDRAVSAPAPVRLVK